LNDHAPRELNTNAARRHTTSALLSATPNNLGTNNTNNKSYNIILHKFYDKFHHKFTPKNDKLKRSHDVQANADAGESSRGPSSRPHPSTATRRPGSVLPQHADAPTTATSTRTTPSTRRRTSHTYHIAFYMHSPRPRTRRVHYVQPHATTITSSSRPHVTAPTQTAPRPPFGPRSRIAFLTHFSTATRPPLGPRPQLARTQRTTSR